MSHIPATPARASRGSRRFASLLALDFGLRARIETDSRQGLIFAGAQDLSARELTRELSDLVSCLRVRSFSLRSELEQVTQALMVNVESGSWRLGRRAATDLGGLPRKRTRGTEYFRLGLLDGSGRHGTRPPC